MAKAAQDEVLLDAVLGMPGVSDDIVGFHLQQAAEKLLKAVLARRGVAYRRTHDLRELMDHLTDARRPVPDALAELDALNPYAVILRYDEVPEPSSLDRTRARGWIRELRAWAESQINA